ncbi:hypothetical protein THASP1DRAFT_27759 [Thamnocephalis sphaerospora]|uniref:Uncharacterized protein n=1 Tax=Thamnocephalis sphaerospora TaxID=78915 RepID=A0A4P9XW03_9FUNG|nr:hypothetical protein THASP1DRAFT_27759 [Thamnocephalis sphaerospora]|eukprot:RKP10477.1 hypothetical protein THASP1DRAFT_27759 [Thamnocephalis sphaerospora]
MDDTLCPSAVSLDRRLSTLGGASMHCAPRAVVSIAPGALRLPLGSAANMAKSVRSTMLLGNDMSFANGDKMLTASALESSSSIDAENASALPFALDVAGGLDATMPGSLSLAAHPFSGSLPPELLLGSDDSITTENTLYTPFTTRLRAEFLTDACVPSNDHLCSPLPLATLDEMSLLSGDALLSDGLNWTDYSNDRCLYDALDDIFDMDAMVQE